MGNARRGYGLSWGDGHQSVFGYVYARTSLFNRSSTNRPFDILANAWIAKFSPIEETLKRISMKSCAPTAFGFLTVQVHWR